MSRTHHSHRILTATALTVALTTVLAGCGAISGGSTTQTEQSTDLREIKTITYVNPLPSYPAFNVAGDCLKEKAEELGWTANQVGITGTAVDNQGSINQISQAIAAGVDGLVVFPTVNSLFTPVIEEARSKGIYVVAMNAGDPSTGQQTQVGTDPTAMGRLVASSLGAKNPDAHVGFLSVSADTQSQKDQIEGFQAEAAENFPDMESVASVYDNGDSTKVADLIGNMLSAHPDIDAIFLTEGAAIAGGITAVREAGKTGQVDVIGLDLTPDTRSYIEDGSLFGVGDQGWCEMGTESVVALQDLSEGKTLEPLIPTTNTFYTQANLPSE